MRTYQEDFVECLAGHMDPTSTEVQWLRDRQERLGTVALGRQGVVEWQLLRELMAAELTQESWSLHEMAVLAAALQGCIPDIGLTPSAKPALLYEDVRDWLEDTDDAGRGDDEATQELLARLKVLSPIREHALVDAVSRWWHHGYGHTPEGWAEVGVRVAEQHPTQGAARSG